MINKKDTNYFFPRSIDINPTAKCNLACTFCWGPDHSIADSLSTEKWKKIIQFFYDHGTDAIVFTGGEPLIRKDINELIRFAKLKGMRVTLSTNAFFLQKRGNEILPYIDKVGIPIDGSNAALNAKMRRGNSLSFKHAIDALFYTKINYPRIQITVRTVVSKTNLSDILNIGQLLVKYQQYFDRWKIYEFTPVSVGKKYLLEHKLKLREFQHTMSSLLNKYSSLPITIYPSEHRIGRYLFIGPDGDISVVDQKGEYKNIGNFYNISKTKLIKNVKSLVDITRNSQHAH